MPPTRSRRLFAAKLTTGPAATSAAAPIPAAPWAQAAMKRSKARAAAPASVKPTTTTPAPVAAPSAAESAAQSLQRWAARPGRKAGTATTAPTTQLQVSAGALSGTEFLATVDRAARASAADPEHAEVALDALVKARASFDVTTAAAGPRGVVSLACYIDGAAAAAAASKVRYAAVRAINAIAAQRVHMCGLPPRL